MWVSLCFGGSVCCCCRCCCWMADGDGRGFDVNCRSTEVKGSSEMRLEVLNAAYLRRVLSSEAS